MLGSRACGCTTGPESSVQDELRRAKRNCHSDLEVRGGEIVVVITFCPLHGDELDIPGPMPRSVTPGARIEPSSRGLETLTSTSWSRSESLLNLKRRSRLAGSHKWSFMTESGAEASPPRTRGSFSPV